jgi:hypothetical protein
MVENAVVLSIDEKPSIQANLTLDALGVESFVHFCWPYPLPLLA